MQRIKEAARRLSSLVNRVVLTRLDNNHKNQKCLVRGVEEQDKEIEFFELYGITTSPRVDNKAEVLRFSLEGYEDHTIALGATGGNDRPRDAKSGEVILYTRWDKQGSQGGFHRIHFMNEGDEIRVTVDKTVIYITRTGVKIKADLEIVGDVAIKGDTLIQGDLDVDGGRIRNNGRIL